MPSRHGTTLPPRRRSAGEVDGRRTQPGRMDEVADRRRIELTLMDEVADCPRTAPARMEDTADRRTTDPTLMDDPADRRRTDLARMEAAAIEAGRWLRRTGRVSLPVRARPRAVTTD